MQELVKAARSLEIKDLPEANFETLFAEEYARSNLPQYHAGRIIKLTQEIVNTYYKKLD